MVTFKDVYFSENVQSFIEFVRSETFVRILHIMSGYDNRDTGKVDTGIEMQWIAVGTGKALVLGKNCDVDVLMVHAPDKENEFIKMDTVYVDTLSCTTILS